MARALVLVMALLAASAAAQQSDPPNSLLLVAKPELSEPSFRESVVLVTQAADFSTVGVILNRPSQARHPATGATLYLGGPVMLQVVVALLRSDTTPQAPAFHVLQGVYLTMHPQNLEGLGQDGQRYRLYNGFSGWAPRQLENEIRRGGWYVLPASEELLFRRDTTGMWQELHERARGERAHAQSAMRVAVHR